MSKEIEDYNKELKSLKINKFDFYKHTIDKDELLRAYLQLGQEEIIDEFASDDDLKEILRYEKWLLGEN